MCLCVTCEMTCDGQPNVIVVAQWQTGLWQAKLFTRACSSSHMVFHMMHYKHFIFIPRGRLNVLVHLLGKPLGALCSEMEGLQSEFKVGEAAVVGGLECAAA